MHRPTLTLIASSLVVLAAGCEPAPDADQRRDSRGAAADDSTSAVVRSAVGRVWADHLDAAKRGDPVGVSAMYANDAVYAVGGNAEVRGRPAIDSLEARGLRAARVLDVRHATHAVRVAGDLAYEIGTIVGPVQPAGDTARVVTFNFMAQWRREPDGAWRLTYLVGR